MKLWQRLRSGLESHDVRFVDPLAGYNRWAKCYADVDNPVLRLESDALRGLLPDTTDMQVLDVGCGTGRVTKEVTEHGATRVFAIDFSENMLQEAKNQLKLLSNAKLIAASATRLPFPNESFDLVTCSLVAGHIEDLAKLINELARVTRPRGQVFISDFHPFGQLLGWKRSFVEQSNGQVQEFAIRYYRHLHADYFRAFKSASLRIEEMLEPCIDDSVKHFFEKSSKDRRNFERFVGYPVVLVIKVTKQ